MSDESSSKRQEKRKRTRLNKDQLSVLETTFETKRYLSKSEVEGLASSLSITPYTVRIWFQNRRARVKKKPRSLSSPSSPQATQGAPAPAPGSSSVSPTHMNADPDPGPDALLEQYKSLTEYALKLKAKLDAKGVESPPLAPLPPPLAPSSPIQHTPYPQPQHQQVSTNDANPIPEPLALSVSVPISRTSPATATNSTGGDPAASVESLASPGVPPEMEATPMVLIPGQQNIYPPPTDAPQPAQPAPPPLIPAMAVATEEAPQAPPPPPAPPAAESLPPSGNVVSVTAPVKMLEDLPDPLLERLKNAGALTAELIPLIQSMASKSVTRETLDDQIRQLKTMQKLFTCQQKQKRQLETMIAHTSGGSLPSSVTQERVSVSAAAVPSQFMNGPCMLPPNLKAAIVKHLQNLQLEQNRQIETELAGINSQYERTVRRANASSAAHQNDDMISQTITETSTASSTHPAMDDVGNLSQSDLATLFPGL